jgi:hypothetical protein
MTGHEPGVHDRAGQCVGQQVGVGRLPGGLANRGGQTCATPRVLLVMETSDGRIPFSSVDEGGQARRHRPLVEPHVEVMEQVADGIAGLRRRVDRLLGLDVERVERSIDEFGPPRPLTIDRASGNSAAPSNGVDGESPIAGFREDGHSRFEHQPS